MRNLKLLTDIEFDLELQSLQESILFSAVDIERNRIFFASSENFLYALQLPSLQKEGPWGMHQLSPEAQVIDLEPGDYITSMDYLMEKEAVIMGTLNGHLLLHNVDDNTAEVVGRVEGGVKSIASSPDGALLAVTAGLGQILVMTHDWEVLYETIIDAPELDNPISADATNGSSNYQFECSISWRGDAKYFATLSGVHNSSSSQKLRIWERDSGSLHAASESKAFMGASLDWMPSGAKVAAVYDRRADKKCPSIVFFERNGLERSSFSIDEPIDAMVEVLKWNCASDLLAAAVACKEYDAIKIWSFSNNHWYLKQEIRHSKKDGVKFIWDPTRPLQLICWTLAGKIISYNFVWTTAVTENSTALVIDNSDILVTPLGLSLMPPPMSLFRMKFPNAVQDVSFFTNNSKNLLAASLSNGSLCVVELPLIETWEQFESKELSVEACHSNMELGTLRHLVWLESHILLCVSHHKGIPENDFSYKEAVKHCSGYYFQEIELLCSENSIPSSVTASGWHAKISKCFPLEEPVIGVAPNPVRKFSAFVQFFGGSIAEYSSISDIKVASGVPCLQKLVSEMGFSSSCPWMSAVPVFEDDRLKPLIFGLDGSGRLHVSGRVLCYNCSSFSFYSNTTGVMQQAITHLILATKQDFLFIVRINDILLQNLAMNFDNFNRGGKKSWEDYGDSIYIWERGAKLVSVIHGDEAAVILQTGRGNLECIYPRKLVLFSIVNALVQTRFKDAILMVRRHRIDFNVIVDHCGWQAFLQCAEEFVRQVDNLGHITEFVCSLKNENVIETLYKNVITFPRPNHSKVSRLDARSKLSSVLLAIRKALEEKIAESPARELCILTTLARSQPPALEEALKRIKVIREMELSGVDTSWRNSYPSAEEALKHLLWLSDSEGVYEAALGLYDLNLAAIVALNSQKDPKEFLPFLQGLECMLPVIMQYKIDLRLHRYESALKHIFSAGEAHHEECMNLMKSKPLLFPLGLQLYADDNKRSEIFEAWGDHLSSEKCFDDAATAYLCCSSLQKALKAYRACGHWKGVFSVAGLLKLGKEEVLQIANELCEVLQALGEPAEAARIAIEYCGDVSTGIGYFITAREWEEALRIGLLHGREELISEVKNSAMECAKTLISEYEEGLEKVGKYLTRYLAVRQRRLLLAAKLQMEDKSMTDIDDDNASETSSTFSGMSAYTTHLRFARTTKCSGTSVSSSSTSKTRGSRRQRNKGGKIRAGSPGEEIALVEHLKGMSLSGGVQRELKSLMHALVMLGEGETAKKLQKVMENFQLSQCAAVKLAEDTVSDEKIDENIHTLEHYLHVLYGFQICLVL
ncbi:Elongator complex protein 1 [Asimina triloba]